MSFEHRTRGESWEKTIAQLGPRTLEVVKALKAAPAGLTAWEIASQTGRLVHAVRPRLTELKKNRGLVRTIGKRFYEPTQRQEAVWVLQDPDKNQPELPM